MSFCCFAKPCCPIVGSSPGQLLDCPGKKQTRVAGSAAKNDADEHRSLSLMFPSREKEMTSFLICKFRIVLRDILKRFAT